jgi:hypothetical protein
MTSPSEDQPEQVMSIASIVHPWLNSGAPPEVLIAALIEREEAIADVLRLAGVQFGLFPEIVAEVLAQVEMGRPISTTQRAMVHSNFHVLMERLRNEQQGGSQ